MAAVKGLGRTITKPREIALKGLTKRVKLKSPPKTSSPGVEG